ncbi:MAG: DUF3618 domain-containing protein [Sporichthyaceae bacterium]
MTNATTVPGGLEAREPAPQPARTPAELEAEIEATRTRLAGTVDAIADRVKPANVARRGAESAKAQVVDPGGGIRADRVAVLAAAVAGVVGLLLWRRSR